MRILVTGGAGYIGSHTVKHLAAHGHELIVLDNLAMGHRWAVQWGPLEVVDLCDAAATARCLQHYQPDGVIHFAALAYVGESVTNPAKYFHTNTVGTLHLLDAMRQAGTRSIVFSSTCATYGVSDAVPITESQFQRPINPYGDSKLAVEKILYWYSQAYGIRYAALRYFNAAGADPDGGIGESHNPETHLIPLIIEAALGIRPDIAVFGTDYPTPDGTCIRDYIHVTDLASAHRLALDYINTTGENLICNLGCGQGYSVREVIQAVAAAAGSAPRVRYQDRRAGDPPSLIADPSQARRILGWQPVHSSIEEIVRTAWRWHSSQVQP